MTFKRKICIFFSTSDKKKCIAYFSLFIQSMHLAIKSQYHLISLFTRYFSYQLPFLIFTFLILLIFLHLTNISQAFRNLKFDFLILEFNIHVYRQYKTFGTKIHWDNNSTFGFWSQFPLFQISLKLLNNPCLALLALRNNSCTTSNIKILSFCVWRAHLFNLFRRKVETLILLIIILKRSVVLSLRFLKPFSTLVS